LAAALKVGEAPALEPVGLRAAWPAVTRTRYAAPEAAESPRRARELRPLPARAPEAKHSFTSLSRAGRAQSEALLDAEAPAQDESLPVETVGSERDPGEPPHPELLALGGLRGAGFGNALHSLLELRVIGTPLLQQRDHVQATLAAAGLRARDFEPLGLAHFSERLAHRLDAALAAPLGLEHAPDLALGAVPARDQRAELGFDFALPEIALADLAAACARPRWCRRPRGGSRA
ncbi:MAG: hypothetical protein ACOVKS_12235, partial [Aquimonas sp.]